MSPEPNKIIYSMIGVSKFYNKRPILKDIYLSYFYGAKIGVVGLNGSGKSSLLRILAGADTDFNGKTVIAPGHTVGFLEQEPQLEDALSVRETVEQGVQQTVDLLNEFNRINERFAEPMSDEDMDKLIVRQGEVQEKLDSMNAWDLDSMLEMALDALRCPPGDTPVKVLSGGERRRVALCRLLLQQPDILLLDEPTNHLDAETVAWLEQHLQRYRGTVIAVTHDRYFLDNVAGWILELDRGQGIPWQGNYSSWLEQKSARLRVEAKGETERQRTLERELEWIRMSPKGRHAKSKARIKAYESLLRQDYEEQARNLEIYFIDVEGGQATLFVGPTGDSCAATRPRRWKRPCTSRCRSLRFLRPTQHWRQSYRPFRRKVRLPLRRQIPYGRNKDIPFCPIFLPSARTTFSPQSTPLTLREILKAHAQALPTEKLQTCCNQEQSHL